MLPYINLSFNLRTKHINNAPDNKLDEALISKVHCAP